MQNKMANWWEIKVRELENHYPLGTTREKTKNRAEEVIEDRIKEGFSPTEGNELQDLRDD